MFDDVVNLPRVDLNVRDRSGDTPLMITLKKNKTEMFDVLVNHPRVDLNVRDRNGDTVAVWAQKNNKHDELRKILANHWANLSIPITDYETGQELRTLAKQFLVRNRFDDD